MVTMVIVLGHKISDTGLEVNPVKIDVVGKLSVSSDVKQLHNFQGYVGFYKRFIRGFSQIAKPLSNLLSANQPYNLL